LADLCIASGLNEIRGTFPHATVGHFTLRYAIVVSMDIAAFVTTTSPST
jgi:hypothetical protein